MLTATQRDFMGLIEARASQLALSGEDVAAEDSAAEDVAAEEKSE